jgi:hypothetical protein
MARDPFRIATRRTAALTHIVGQARAYGLQLEASVGELCEVRAADLAFLLQVVSLTQRLVAVVDRMATRALRDDP